MSRREKTHFCSGRPSFLSSAGLACFLHGGYATCQVPSLGAGMAKRGMPLNTMLPCGLGICTEASSDRCVLPSRLSFPLFPASSRQYHLVDRRKYER